MFAILAGIFFPYVPFLLQREATVFGRAKEEETARDQENQYIYWIIYYLFCPICHNQVGAVQV